MSSSVSNLCDFIHEAQKERGMVSLFLKDKVSASPEKLEAQFAIVDLMSKPLSFISKKQSTKIEPFLNALQYLPAKRKYVIARMIEPSEALKFYSRDTIMPAIEILQELVVMDDTNHPAKVSAFINFVQWKERVGLERALGAQLVDIDWSNALEFKDRLEHIVSEQLAYERMFLALADEQGKQAIEKLKKSNPIFCIIDELNQSFAKGVTSRKVKLITAQEWFDLFSAKMDLLHEVGKSIADNLAAVAATPMLQAQEPANLKSSVRMKMEKIQALPLFAELDAQTLQDILKYARVVSHSKGAMIFMQGEQASRFYIILEGWVKLFKGSIDGQESILQISTVGAPLLETMIFSNAPFPVNAQAVDQVMLLSIPASLIREKLQNNKKLAINMLSTVANRSHQLISQFEQLTLKTVSQRVGWFLLKLFLESGDRSKGIKLPYDKALIAGYLGMKPETFSRTLQQLKEEGIDIDRNVISLPDVFALCSYCDSELAAKCARHGTADCSNPDCGAA